MKLAYNISWTVRQELLSSGLLADRATSHQSDLGRETEITRGYKLRLRFYFLTTLKAHASINLGF